MSVLSLRHVRGGAILMRGADFERQKSPAFAREPADGPIRGGQICDESSIPRDPWGKRRR